MTTSLKYDNNGNRTKLTYPDASFISYDYDELNRLTSVIASSGEAISTYTYDALSRRTAASYLNGTSASYTYDAISRLTELTNNYLPASNTYTYTYDKVGNRLSKTDSTGTENYTYDNIYQVTNVTYPDTTTTAYNYDPLGNRASIVNGGTATYTTNNLNQYTSVGGITHTHDANGNLTSDGTNTYTYDSENRLTGATVIASGSEAIYTYDAFGRRITKTMDGVTTTFLYDGDQVIAEYDASDTLTAKYVYGTGIDEVVTMERGGATYYYHYDGLGSVTALTDANGDLTEAYSYDIFGSVTSSFSSVGNPYYFTGRRYDPETGLYYYRARYYSPGVGRFLQRDPVGHYGDRNLYRYCYNNPTNYIDPFGYIDIYINRGYENRGSLEGDVGHVAIGFNNDPNDTYGFYPTEPVEANAKDLVRNHPGVVKHSDPMTRDPRYYDEKITIPTTPEQDQKIRNYSEKKKNDPDPWNLPFYNCTDFVGEALQEGDINVDTGKPISSPRELSDNLRNREAKCRK